MFKKIGLMAVLLLVVSCNATRKPVESASKVAWQAQKQGTATTANKKNSSNSGSVTGTKDLVTSYIETYKDVAMNNMRKFGIPASIVLAQGILESGAGQSKLALLANNHFGIKCNSDWMGEIIRHDDDTSQECFRKYKNSAESYDDHARFLTSKSRYASLFGLAKDDYIGWANGLRAAGYATDPNYPQKLVASIERYDLRKYDAQVLNKKPIYSAKSPNEGNGNSQRSHLVEKGDTLYSISKKYNVSVEELIKKNNIQDNKLALGQSLYY